MAIKVESMSEAVRPLHVRACVWCEKDELNIPLQDCMMCSHSRQDSKTVWCSWAPAEKPCAGCGIPAEYCEPDTCMIWKTIKKAAR